MKLVFLSFFFFFFFFVFVFCFCFSECLFRIQCTDIFPNFKENAKYNTNDVSGIDASGNDSLGVDLLEVNKQTDRQTDKYSRYSMLH